MAGPPVAGVSKVPGPNPTTNQPTRVGIRYLDDGRKERYAKRSGTSLGIISPARKAYAKKRS